MIKDERTKWEVIVLHCARGGESIDLAIDALSSKQMDTVPDSNDETRVETKSSYWLVSDASYLSREWL